MHDKNIRWKDELYQIGDYNIEYDSAGRIKYLVKF